MITAYHAKYFAHALLRSSTEDGVEKISRSLFDAAVDLNPHQIDAALFALKSPLSKGVVLADEVGLGKTIEASLVLCQYWAERKRRLFVVCPAALRKQWNLELLDKFNIPSIIIDARNFNEFISNGHLNPFEQADKEYELYRDITDFLQGPDTYALSASQRTLITLVIRKILASSSYALIATLETIKKRLEQLRDKQPVQDNLVQALLDDESLDDEELEEFETSSSDALAENQEKQIDLEKLKKEITLLAVFIEQAKSIKVDSKTSRLKEAIEQGFTEATKMGAQRKVIVFTESRRTQSYLKDYLDSNGYAGRTVIFNGTNTDPESRKIYENWLAANKDTGRLSGVQSADRRNAILDYFRNTAEVFIATESAAEGINLQFCSLVINYDLPWNPQRIEQRIGRCHRYGQKHDVVVVNFLNRNNEADQRVFQLLSEKFMLFEGVFGASDEVLGAIESGVDFEKRIADIYQRCRTPDEIKTSFDQLQLELNIQIDEAMTRTRRQLLENFDDEVREKLRMSDESSRLYLNRYERLLMQLTRYELRDHAEFLDDSAFRLKSCPFAGDIPTGLYELPRRSGEAHLYRLSHPLAANILEQAKGRDVHPAEIIFDYSGHEGKVSRLEPYIGKRGELLLSLFTVESLDQAEDHVLCAAITEDGQILEEELAQRLLSLPAKAVSLLTVTPNNDRLRSLTEQRQNAIQKGISEKNARYFEAEAEKLDGWADDLKLGLEREIKDLDWQIKEARRAATASLTLEEKLAGQKQIKALEAQRGQKRKSLFEAQDEIDRQREKLISEIEGKLQQKITSRIQFVIRWTLQ